MGRKHVGRARRNARPDEVKSLSATVVGPGALAPTGSHRAMGAPGRDLASKPYVVELIVYVPLLFVLLERFGIVGAAAAWSIRVTLDCVLRSGACAQIVSGFLPRWDGIGSDQRWRRASCY